MSSSAATTGQRPKTLRVLLIAALMVLTLASQAWIAPPADAVGVNGGLSDGCIHEVERWVQGAGTDSVQYFTWFLDLRSDCKLPHDVTIDVALWPDPQCETIDPGETVTFTWTQSAQWAGGDARGITGC
jgi:hypothetical protein